MGEISVGIAYSGDKPTLADTQTTVGQGGDPGAGGKPGTNDGVVGVAQAEYEVK